MKTITIEELLQLDQNILLFIQEYIRHDWMDWFWKGITHLGDAGIFWILLTIVLLIPKKTRKAGLASALALIIGTLITNVAIKNMVARIRPYEVIQELELMIEKQKDFSFPSGHTCAIYKCKEVFPKKWRIAAMVLATLIALSRLYVGVHYPTDVLGGLIVGLFSGWAGWKIEELIMKKKFVEK
jgi:membrane-associated phospholipid phosphatase